VVTFDDGFADNREVAFPVLERLGIPAVFYVCTGYVGTDRTFDWVGSDASAERHRILSWEEVSELAGAGHVIGSHTVTHRELPDLPDDELVEEVEGSKRVLQERLGAAIDDFCAPRGRQDSRVAAAIEGARYERAVITPSRGRLPHHRLSIERAGIYRHDSPWRFRVKVLGLYRLARDIVPRRVISRGRSSSPPAPSS